MKNFYKDLHVLTTFLLSLMMFVVTLLTDNPLILLYLFVICITVFITNRSLKSLRNGFIIFIPFSIVSIIINLIFVQQGSIILFSIGNRNFTLEAVIYSLLLSFKLLIVIYIFSLLSIMLDLDRSISYFSSVIPKSTLIFMISLKLFPIMKKRIYSLKEIYSIRGVDFEGKKLKFKLLSYIPVLSILLEDSLEKSFDIGEASYVRGFLSTKRSVYDRQKYSYFDYIISLTCIVIVLIYLVIKLLGLDAFDIYNFGITSFSLNKGVVIISMLFFILLMELIFLWRKFVVRYESYKI